MDMKTVVEFTDEVPESVNSIALCGLFRSRGGVSRVIEQQAIDLTEAGYDVTIFALESDMEPPDGVTLQTVSPSQKYFLFNKIYWLLFPILPWMIYTVVRLRQYDLVITHRYPFTVASYIASRTSDMKYTFWSHPPTNSAQAFSGPASVWYRLIHRFETQSRSVAGADYICAVSEDSKEYLQSHIDRSVIVVPNKINERRFTEITSKDVLQNKYRIEDEEQIALFVGRITERKNIRPIVKIFNELGDRLDNVRLIIAGSESQPEYADKVKKEAGSNITFTGYVSDEDLAGLYSMADVFVSSSLEEGWGLPITEADHFDTPIVAFKSHPAARVAETKSLVEPGDYEAFERKITKYLNETSTDNE